MQKIVKLVYLLAPKPHRPMQIVARAIALLVLMSLEITTILVGTTPALAAPIFTPSDQDQSITSFISAYYDPNSHFFYTDTQNHAEADLWTEAVDWGIVMDAYSRTKGTNYNQMIGDIYNHVTSVYGANCGQWQVPNNSNETLAWWAEASVQAYDITNNTTYKTCAQAFFDKIYQSWDTTQAGGGIWTLNNQTTQKNMATNALAAMTAAQLSTILGNSTYLSDAQTIYTWIRSHLTNLSGSSGAVYDRYDNTSATVIMNQFSDNYGLFIGAALALNDATKNNSSATNGQSVNYLSDASTVANASLTNLTISGDGIIQYESDCGNNTSAGDTSNSLSGNNGNITNDGSFVNENNTCNGGANERALYKGIYAHYLGDLAFNSNYAVSNSAAYGQVLDENAALAWNDRLPSNNLVGADWAEPAPTGAIKSWEAAPAVEILQILPNNNNIATYQSEDATLQGGLSLGTQFGGYMSNSGYIQNWTQNGQSVSFTISAPAAGTELLIMRYSAGAGNADRYLEVNGAQNTANIPTGPIYASSTSNSVIDQISFPGTNNWNSYDLDAVPVLLTQGNNTITISFDSSQNSQNALNLDELTVTPGFPPPFAAASSNSVSSASSASTTAASTSVTYPGSFRYYYAERCDSGAFLPKETPDRNILFSSITHNNAGGVIFDQTGKVPNYFNGGSNVGKTDNGFKNGRDNVESYGNNVGNRENSFQNSGDNVGNRENSFQNSGNNVGNHGNSFQNSGNNVGNRENSFQNSGDNVGNRGDNVGKCGNRSPIPGELHPIPNGPHTSGGFQPLHTSRGSQQPHTSGGFQPLHTSRGSQQPHTSAGLQPLHTSRGSQQPHTSTGFQPLHTSRGSQQPHTSTGFQPLHASRGSQPSHTPKSPIPPYAPAPGPIPVRTPKPISSPAKKPILPNTTKRSTQPRTSKKSIPPHAPKPKPTPTPTS